MTIDEKDFFHQATMRICSSLDIQTAMWRALKYLEDFMPMAGIDLVLAEPGLAVVETVARITQFRIEEFHRITPLPREMRTEIERAWVGLQDVLIVNRPEKNMAVRTMTRLDGKPDLSVMLMRLKMQDKRLFALVAHAAGRDQYTKEHARLLALLHDPFAITMSNALKHQEVIRLKEMLADDNQYLQQEMLRLSGDEIIGRDKGLKKVFEMVRHVAPLNSPVLLLGETGTGKEVIANAIHYLSPRRNGPFIKVNCGAIPETLIDSELFGHEKGAFTGALAQKRGRFERAHMGTILLDEIGELPVKDQVRLLRVIQNKEIERVGGTKPVPINIRIIASTHRDLESMISSNRFRADLWFRLHVFPLKIPPLRERKQDIPDLVRYFIKRKSIEKNIPTPPIIESETYESLQSYHWPGNVRELENVVERAIIQHLGRDTLSPMTFEGLYSQKNEEHQPLNLIAQDETTSEIEKKIALHTKDVVKQTLEQIGLLNTAYDAPNPSAHNKEAMALEHVVSLHIQKVLKLTNGKINGPGGAAELLKLNPSTLRYKMQKLGLGSKGSGKNH